MGSLVIVVLLVAVVVLIAGNRLANRLAGETQAELEREARLVGSEWHAGMNDDSLADAAGAALGRRVTLIRPDGKVVGDSEFSGDDLEQLENHYKRPEVTEAREHGIGTSRRRSASAGDDEFYLAIKHPQGTVRVSVSTAKFRAIVNGARDDVIAAGLLALAGTLIVAFGFSRAVSQPIIELRDVATAIAAGHLERRPALSAPGEVGDLAAALQRMTEQLSSRLSALQAEDALLSAVIDSLDEGIVAVSTRGSVVRLNESARRLLDLRANVPFSTDLLPQDRLVRDAVRGAMSGVAAGPLEIARRRANVDRLGAPAPRRRRGGRRAGSHDAATTRDDSPRLRGQRLTRAQDAAHRHRRIRRDAPRPRASRRTTASASSTRSRPTRGACSASWTICSTCRDTNREAGGRTSCPTIYRAS